VEGLIMDLLRRRPSILAGLLVAAAFAAARSWAAASEPARATEVKVERMRPVREKLGTLQFLHANRDFIRARYDRLIARPLDRRGSSDEIDPRFLNYADLLNQVRAAQDTAGRAEDERARRHLLESIAQLGTLESDLDRVERQLAAQRVRLAILEDDFTGRQRTTMLVVVKGFPSQAPITEIGITIDDGATQRVALTPEQQQSLRQGGLLEIFHGAVEPREQVVQVTLFGAAWPAGDSGYMTLEPLRDRLTFLRLDLSAVQPAQGGASIQASTWLHEAPAPSVDG
jgi:hypothetical protein